MRYFDEAVLTTHYANLEKKRENRKALLMFIFLMVIFMVVAYAMK